MPAKNPIVSVILPIYNAERHIIKSIDTILQQTFQDFEIIAIDDGSTDQSIDILKKHLESLNEKRVKIFTNPTNSGLSHTLNRGIAEASGEYLARMDADDLCMLDRLEKQVAFLEHNPEIDVVGTGLETFGKTLPKKIFNPALDAQIKAALLFDCALTLVMMRKSKLMANQLSYDGEFNGAEDYEMWTRCAKYLKLANIQEVLFKYRIHATQETTSKKSKTRDKATKAREAYLINCNIHFEPELLELHHSIARYDCAQINDVSKLTQWKNTLFLEYKNPMLTRELEIRFTKICMLGRNPAIQKWAQLNGLYKPEHFGFFEKSLYSAKWMIKSILGRNHA